MLISPAFAQAAGGGGGSGLEALLPLVLIFVVFYFLLIRPQQKKAKQHKEMLSAIRRGDKVVTGGGIMGSVTKVNDDNEVTVEIIKDVKVRVRRHLIHEVLSKMAPVKAVDKSKGASNDSSSQQGPLSGLKKLFGGKS